MNVESFLRLFLLPFIVIQPNVTCLHCYSKLLLLLHISMLQLDVTFH